MINFVEGAAIGTLKFLFALVLVIVVSIYMLLDMPRLSRFVDRRFPPHPGSDVAAAPDRALAGELRPRAGAALADHRHERRPRHVAARHARAGSRARTSTRSLFGAWVAITELIPYIGPWLGAIPPFIYALVVHPISALWVALLFLGIHQLEGHVVVPNVMGNALRLHPLLVIFGLLAGGEIYGLPGALVALPLLAAGRAIWEFFGERVALESWERGQRRSGRGRGGGDALGRRRVPPADPPAAAQPVSLAATPLLAARGAAPPVRPDERARAGRARDLGRRGARARRPERRRQVDAARAARRRARAERRPRRAPQGRARRLGAAADRRSTARLSARENLELFARLEGEHDPRAAAARLLDAFELPGERGAEREPLGRQPPAPEPRDRAARRPGRAAARRADRRARPRAAPRGSGSAWPRCESAGGAVVFATQNLEEVERVADRVAALREGRLVFAGTVDEYDRAHVESLSA